MTIQSVAVDFCLAHSAADAVQVQAIRPEPDGRGGTYDHVYDVGEFQSDWGDLRPSAVVLWLARSPRSKVRLTALRRTGERREDGEGWEATASALVTSKGA